MSLTICSASCCALAEGKVSSARFPCRYIKKAEAGFDIGFHQADQHPAGHASFAELRHTATSFRRDAQKLGAGKPCQAMRRHLPFLMRADPRVTLRMARHSSTKPAVSSSGKYMLRHARQPRPTAAFPRSSGNAGSLYNTCRRSPKDT